MIVRHIHMHIPCEAHIVIESMGHGEVLDVLVRREDRGARAADDVASYGRSHRPTAKSTASYPAHERPPYRGSRTAHTNVPAIGPRGYTDAHETMRARGVTRILPPFGERLPMR